MKRAAKVIGGAVLALVGVMLVNAVRHRAPPSFAEAALPPDGIDASAIAAHLSEAVRFKTISHADSNEDDPAALAALRSFFEKTYPRTHATLEREIVNGAALLYTWKGSDPTAPPILLLAHQDVVPIEPGTESQWTHPPFDGVIADGFVWGRGAMDDKSSLVCLFEAIEGQITKGWRPKRTVYLASGFDEEVGGARGSKKIAELLKSRGVKLAWVLDEGSSVTRGVITGVDRAVAPVAITEKGYLTVELTAKSEGGHSSMPPAQTAIGVLSSAIARLEMKQLPARLLPGTRAMLETLAPEMPFGRRVMLSNLWLTEPLVVRGMSKERASNAVVRTTTAPTIVSGGVKDNVLPSTARGVVNFRILPGDTVDGVLRHVDETVADERIKITKVDGMISEPPAPSSTQSAGWRVVEHAIHRAFPDAVVVPSVVVGMTDSRHFADLAADTYRFAPFTLAKTDLPRFHGLNERVSVEGLATAVRAYRQIVEEGAGK